MPVGAWRCPSCAAPVGEVARPAFDCLAVVSQPKLPPGVTGEPVSLLGALAVGGLAAAALLQLTQAVAALKSAGAIGDGDTDASSVHGLRLTLTILLALAGVGATVAFFFWLRRVVRNADRLGLLRQRFNSGWTVGAWFVPVLNLWRPKQIVNDAWSGSGAGSRTLVDWWWGLWLISSYVFAGVGDVMLSNASTAGSRRSAYDFIAFSDLLGAVVWALTALLVHVLTKHQRDAVEDPSA
ncbi:MAG: hypothetical protein QOJ92_1491 [Frankiales bacterium]|nr:hypothetical protein [Frankiales bacterium]